MGPHTLYGPGSRYSGEAEDSRSCCPTGTCGSIL
jgi:hypothetical protein